MSFLLKIVEGPNKGAEIALVEGVAVTIGKGDDCDIVLADLTLPDNPLKVEATADGVAIDGSPVEPLEVKTIGATSFAVGPAETAWGALKWPKKESESHESPEKPEASDSSEKPESPKPPESPESSDAPSKKRGWGCGCVFFLIGLAMVLAALAWFFRDKITESDRFEQFQQIGRGWYARFTSESRDAKMSGEKALTLSDVAGKYGLTLAESDGAAKLSGNLKTRRERLAATAEAYQARPGVEIDLSDDESFRASAEDALFTLTEGAIKVVAATNRVLKIAGSSSSPMKLKKTLEALNSDLTRLDNIDASGVVIGGVAAKPNEDDGESVYSVRPRKARKSKASGSAISFPVCGILTTPYPCLVMRDGRRIMEGAAIGDSVIVEIGADSVVLTNATGRFTWKP